MQSLLDDFYDSCKRQDYRHAMLDQVALDPRVKRLLLALDELAERQRVLLVDGATQISATLGIVRHYLSIDGTPPPARWKPTPKNPHYEGPTRNSIRDWIDLATSTTPYLEVKAQDNCPHLFLIRWNSVFHATDNSVRGCNEASPARPASTVQAAATSGGQRGGQRGGQSPVDPLLTPSLQNPEPRTGVLDINTQQTQYGGAGGIDPGQRSQFPPRTKGEIPRTFRGTKRDWYVAITAWSRAVFARNLVDPNDVEELYGMAVGLGLLQPSEQNRFRVFCQAAHDHAHAKRRGAIFEENVAFNEWRADLNDEDDARIMMRRVDEPLLVEPEQPYPFERQENEAAETKQNAYAGLAKFVEAKRQ